MVDSEITVLNYSNADRLTLGEFLKAYRISYDLTAEQLAARLEIQESELIQMEKGQTKISLELAEDFAKKLNYSANYFRSLC